MDIENNEEYEEFVHRKNSVFSELDKIKSNLSVPKDEGNSMKRKKPSSDLVTDISVPNFKRDSDKWKRYDLEDTELSDNRQNTLAAFSFLHEVEKRSKIEPNQTELSEDPMNEENGEKSAIKFKKPAHIKVKNTAEKMITEAEDCGHGKVELDHLEENVSAAEYQAEIQAKWEESNKSNPVVAECDNVSFKNTPRASNKKSRSLRTRHKSDSD